MNDITKSEYSADNSLILHDLRPLEPLPKQRDYELYLYEIPKSQQTREQVAKAVAEKGSMIRYAAVRLLSKDICLSAVEQNGLALQYVPTKYVDEALCMAALKQNGNALQYVPDEMKHEGMYRAAVASAGDAIGIVPNDLVDDSMCRSAVCATPASIHLVPSDRVTDELIDLALGKDPTVLKFLSNGRRTRRRCEMAVKSNPLCLEWIPDEYKTDDVCLAAFERDPMVAPFLPHRLLTYERCAKAIHQDWHVIEHLFLPRNCRGLREVAVSIDWRACTLLPSDSLDVHLCTKALASALEEFQNSQPTLGFLHDGRFKRDVIALREHIPDSVAKDISIVRLERRLGIRRAVAKRFSVEEDSFVVKDDVDWHIPYTLSQYQTTLLETFEEFASFLDGDLRKADLREAPVGEVDFSSVSLDGALLPPGVSIDGEAFPSGLYDAVISSRENKLVSWPARKGEAKALGLCLRSEVLEKGEIGGDPIYYISDIHLEHCIRNKYPSGATDQQIVAFIRGLVDRITKSRTQDIIQELYADSDLSNSQALEMWRETSPEKIYGTLFIAGDTSHSFELAKLFYQELSMRWEPADIVVVLGNHELWERTGSSSCADRVTAAVSRYRSMLSELGITLLQNELLLVWPGARGPHRSSEILSASDIFDEGKRDDIERLCDYCPLIVLGGIGFAAESQKFNADSGIYRDAVSRCEEKRLTQEFSALYERVVSLAGIERVVVLTHMPYWDWTTRRPQSNWIYVSGHTHANAYMSSTELTLYADNQIGYKRKTIGLRKFFISPHCDIFIRLKDGGYRITISRYLDFCQRIGIRCQLNRSGEVVMLKRGGYYVFFLEHAGKRYLLEGGNIHNIPDKPYAYYYERMSVYASVVKRALDRYYKRLKKIAVEVRSFGGQGSIHGCIVDIDYSSHLYVNIFDGSITPYYATSMTEKVAYKDIPSLLANHLPRLLPSYKKVISNTVHTLEGEIHADVTETTLSKDFQFVADTTMYRASRTARSIQYLFETNVIRVWNDEAIEKIYASIQESGEMEQLGPEANRLMGER